MSSRRSQLGVAPERVLGAVVRASLEPLEAMMSHRAMRLIRTGFERFPRATELQPLLVLVLVLATIRGLVLLRVRQPGYNFEPAWEDCRTRLLAMLEPTD